jgi:type I restriction enzyme S subunit
MSFPRYPSYKDSGVTWLGDVPAHWQVLPCRAIVHERSAKNEGAACTDYLSLMANVGIIPYAEKGDVGNKKPEDVSKCKIVTRGDFVINSMNYGIGSYGLSEYDGVCSPVYIVLKPQSDIVESRFAFRIFENRAFQTFAQSFGNGILEHRCAINWDILKGIGVGVPPRIEQMAILAFLDRETAKIDELVAEQQRLIELLEEKRQSVISQAVTKGLNRDVSLKSPGIEWLGDVPSHWAVRRGRFVYFKLDLPPDPQDGVVTAFRDGQVTLRENRRTEGYTFAVLEGGYQRVRVGDLVINGMDAFAGAIGVSDSIGKCTPEYVVLAPTRTDTVNEYFATILRLMARRRFIYVICPSVRERAPRFRFEAFKDVLLPIPPAAEQQGIVELIESLGKETRSLSAAAEQAIDLLQERRSALISAAVTGQIDVRGLVNAEAA